MDEERYKLYKELARQEKEEDISIISPYYDFLLEHLETMHSKAIKVDNTGESSRVACEFLMGRLAACYIGKMKAVMEENKFKALERFIDERIDIEVKEMLVEIKSKDAKEALRSIINFLKDMLGDKDE